MKFKKNDKGFSLVELIIVIAIMVALVAVLAPQFTKYVEKSRKAVDISAVHDMINACKTVSVDSEYYDDAKKGFVLNWATTGVLTVSDATGTNANDNLQAALQELLGDTVDPQSKDFTAVTITYTPAAAAVEGEGEEEGTDAVAASYIVAGPDYLVDEFNPDSGSGSGSGSGS